MKLLEKLATTATIAATILLVIPGAQTSIAGDPNGNSANSTTAVKLEPKATHQRPVRTEILWDKWGVPHIFARDSVGAFRAFGWAQMHSHGNLLLRLYAQGRGRAAEYWGEQYLQSDRDIRLLGLPQEGQRWYELQSPKFKAYLDAFATGINEYAKQHPDKIALEVKAVLPVSPVDVSRHMVRDLASFVTATSATPDCAANLPGLRSDLAAGSNAWAIAPSRSTSGKAMLLANPHLFWSGHHLFYEAQIAVPNEGVNSYGAALVGMPVLNIAFNDALGWSLTVNPIDTCDMYRLTLSDKGRSYRFDDQVLALQTRVETIHVLQADGSLREESYTIGRSIHGPVVKAADGNTYAIRIVGLGRFATPGAAEQWWDMGRARHLTQFEAALQRLQLPMFNVIYADRDGNTLALFNGLVPRRSRGDWNFWSQPVPGDTSKTLWTETLAYTDLPKVTNPSSGWLQNSNSAPWYMTSPQLNPANYLSYIAPTWILNREQRAIRMLTGDTSISFEELIADKHSTRSDLAARVLPDLIVAARQSDSAEVREAAKVLSNWDREFNADSPAALLFRTWERNWRDLAIKKFVLAGGQLPSTSQTRDFINSKVFFSKPFVPQDVLGTPFGLADRQLAVQALEVAADEVQKLFGTLEVSWGSVARFRRGQFDLPGNGGPESMGIFRKIDYPDPTDPSPKAAFFGESFVAAVEFSQPVRAMVINTYGNATQPDSPHLGDQLTLAAKKQLRPAWRTRSEIEANLAARKVF